MPIPEEYRAEMRAVIDSVRQAAELREPARFEDRLHALDRLEFEVLDRLDGLLPVGGEGHESPVASGIRNQATVLVQELDACNDALFRAVRARIRDSSRSSSRSRSAVGADLFELLREHAGQALAALKTGTNRNEPGYDALDALVNGLFSDAPLPVEAKAREPEMVFYQKTPVRVILELVERASFDPEDTFYDLGSGLGQIPLLVHLLCGARAVGVEFDPAYVRYAEQCATDLGVALIDVISGTAGIAGTGGVSFQTADIRNADLSTGTVFFLYTPFTGAMLQEVLEKLRLESSRRPLRIFSYGPCTHELFRQKWLHWENPGTPHTHGLGVFRTHLNA